MNSNLKNSNEWRKKAGQKRRDSSREKILNTAQKLFLKYGYTNVSVEKIAQLTKVGPATVYNHFGNKSSIAASLFRELIKKLEKKANEDINAGIDLESAVHNHFKQLAKLATNQKEMFLTLFQAINEFAFSVLPNKTQKDETLSENDPRIIAPLPQPLAFILEANKSKHNLTGKTGCYSAAAMMINSFIIRVSNGDNPKQTGEEIAKLLLYGICGKM